MTPARAKFINDNYPLAESVTAGTGIFPEVLLAQAIVESQKNVGGTYVPGKTELAESFNNYFGIKTSPQWTGKTVTYKTREYVNDYVQGVFRVYNSKTESFKDYVKFLKTNPRYSAAFKAKTPLAQIKAIAAAGYATDPNYSAVLGSIVLDVESLKKKAKWQELDF